MAAMLYFLLVGAACVTTIVLVILLFMSGSKTSKARAQVEDLEKKLDAALGAKAAAEMSSRVDSLLADQREKSIETLQDKVDVLTARSEETQKRLDEEHKRNRTLHSQMKSSQVRLGKVAENMAPFLDSFPYDPEKCRFIGDPVDLIVFEPDGIRIVEVKSGKAQLAPVQRAIRDLVAAGKVSFEVFRVNGESNAADE